MAEFHGCTGPNCLQQPLRPLIARAAQRAYMTSFRGIIRNVALSPRRMAQALITAYRLTLSPFVGFECRHLPSCSAYASEAIGRFGLWGGGWMTLARLCRCHPFGSSGLDFVPHSLPYRTCWYLPWRYGRWRGTNTGPEHESASRS